MFWLRNLFVQLCIIRLTNIFQDEDSALEESNNAEESKSFSMDMSIAYDSKDSTLVNNSFSSEELIKNSTWKLGQLAWARMSIYPFWPCIITHDPNSLMIYQKVQSTVALFNCSFFFFSYRITLILFIIDCLFQLLVNVKH